MSFYYRTEVKSNLADEVIYLSGEMNARDYERLEDFAEYARVLLNSRFVRENMKPSFKIRQETGKNLEIEATFPPENEVKIFLYDYRPIGLQDESTYFYKVCSILSKYLDHDFAREYISKQRKIFQGEELTFKTQARSTILNSDKFLNDWLNGFKYHRDKDKQKAIRELHLVIPQELIEVGFFHLLSQKARAIHNLAGLNQVIIGKQPMFESSEVTFIHHT